MLATMVGQQKKFQVSDNLKKLETLEANVRNYKFLAKYFYL